MNALEVKNLCKDYPSFRLDNVSFCVEEGHIAGLVGANGAGKSTTLKSLMGLVPSEGEIFVYGVPFRGDEARAKSLIGYAGGGFRAYSSKKCGAVAKAVAPFYPAWSFERFRSLLDSFGISPEKKVGELSDGMKVKFAVALALSHGAKLLILDEPTSGLDPLSREEFLDAVLELSEREKVTVLFSTHIASDLTRIADDIIYLSAGKVLAEESLPALMKRYEIAVFDNEPNEKIIGLKRVKNGFEGLILRGQKTAGVTREPTLDEIMIHLEAERRYA